MKRVAILGSTGSIGVNTLEVVASHPARFRVEALAAGKNVGLLADQAQRFRPRLVAAASAASAARVSRRLPGGITVLSGPEALLRAVRLKSVDLVVMAIPGMAGLHPVFEALARGKTVAIASKEVIVSSGELLIKASRRHGGRLLPVDSEHSAVFQCLRGERRRDVQRIVLTASGGPFLNSSARAIVRATPARALAHPRWKMGEKVSLDSATMMNKGLEVLEARTLFGLPLERIEVLVHPQSVVHALVEMKDGSVLAQLAPADMRLPIQYALNYPRRLPSSFARLNLDKLGRLDFKPPDRKKFPAIRLAYRAGEEGGTMPAVLNAANEVAGKAFLAEKISFPEICRIVEAVMNDHRPVPLTGLEPVTTADAWARRRAAKYCREKEAARTKLKKTL